MLIEIPDKELWLKRAKQALDDIAEANKRIKDIHTATVAKVKLAYEALPWWKRFFKSVKYPSYCANMWSERKYVLYRIINALNSDSTGNITITEQEFEYIVDPDYLVNLERCIYWSNW